MSIGPVRSLSGRRSVRRPHSGPMSRKYFLLGVTFRAMTYLRMAIEPGLGDRVVVIMVSRQPATAISPLAVTSAVIDARCRSRSWWSRESKRRAPSLRLPTPTALRQCEFSGFEGVPGARRFQPCPHRVTAWKEPCRLEIIRGDRVP